MKARLAVLLAIVGASLGLVACGGSDESTTVTEADTAAESPAAEKKIEKIEQETKEVELEAALAKKEAAQQAAKAKKAAAQRVAAEEVESDEGAVAEGESSS